MKWKIKNESGYYKNVLADKFHPVILRLLAIRGITDPGDIERFFSFAYDTHLTNPLLISGVKEAVDRISKALEKNEMVAVFGDYDADGVTAAVLLSEALKNLGFKKIAYYIPDRQLEGYGLNEKALDYLAKLGVTLIITVDCGIANIQEVEYAVSLNMDVIVTDHHHVGKAVPKALAVINPHQKESGFDFKDFSGVGVVFKLTQAIYQTISPDQIDQLKWTLDLVAIGTIADCVPLLGENRILVKYGLIVIAKTRRTGLREIFQVGNMGIDENHPPSSHQVAFHISPRINAAGRMDHANMAYEILREKDHAKAREMALELEEKNQERQKVTSQIVREIQVIASNTFKDKKFIFAKNIHWPVGVLGLAAGKIADEFRKPTIVLQEQEREYVGSLRSIPEINIMEVLEDCSDSLLRFGGHAQAAGITVAKNKIEEFFVQIDKVISEKLKDIKPVEAIDIDLEISSEDIGWELMESLNKLEPFGVGNPEPVFLMKEVSVLEAKICGNGHKHLKLSLKGGSKSPKIFDAIGFSLGEKFSALKTGDKINVVFNLCEDNWNGNKKIQLKLIDIKNI